MGGVIYVYRFTDLCYFKIYTHLFFLEPVKLFHYCRMVERVSIIQPILMHIHLHKSATMMHSAIQKTGSSDLSDRLGRLRGNPRMSDPSM